MHSSRTRITRRRAAPGRAPPAAAARRAAASAPARRRGRRARCAQRVRHAAALLAGPTSCSRVHQCGHLRRRQAELGAQQQQIVGGRKRGCSSSAQRAPAARMLQARLQREHLAHARARSAAESSRAPGLAHRAVAGLEDGAELMPALRRQRLDEPARSGRTAAARTEMSASPACHRPRAHRCCAAPAPAAARPGCPGGR